MFSFFFNSSSSSSSPAMSADSIVVRPNRYISEEQLAQDTTTATEGRTIGYETRIIYTPVKVSSRPSSSDKALKSKRVVVSKEEMDGLNGLLERMGLGEQEDVSSAKQDEFTPKTPRTPRTIVEETKEELDDDDDDNDDESCSEHYGRYTQTIRVGSTTKKVVRSRRLSP